jgi:hypothetical protein
VPEAEKLKADFCSNVASQLPGSAAGNSFGQVP